MNEKRLFLLRIILRFLAFPILMGLFVLLPAGTLDYWQAYLYFFCLLIPLIINMTYLYIHDKDLLERRMRTQEREKQQKVFLILSSISIIGAFVVPGLDKRYIWSQVPFVLVIIADIVVILSYLFIAYVFKTNTYASRVVEVEDGQKVISTGPYAYVRHPMYTGMIVLYLATPIALGSFWGVIPAVMLPFLLILRISNEEKVLCENLEGYKEYLDKVKYRLIPFIW